MAGNYTVVVRDCTLDNGGMTKDVEIGALDHCGWIKEIMYEDTVMKGCLTICENDGCNEGSTVKPAATSSLSVAVMAMVILGST